MPEFIKNIWEDKVLDKYIPSPLEEKLMSINYFMSELGGETNRSILSQNLSEEYANLLGFKRMSIYLVNFGVEHGISRPQSLELLASNKDVEKYLKMEESPIMNHVVRDKRVVFSEDYSSLGLKASKKNLETYDNHTGASMPILDLETQEVLAVFSVSDPINGKLESYHPVLINAASIYLSQVLSKFEKVNQDELTGLGNRNVLNEYLRIKTQNPLDKQLFAILIDIDKFKDVNDIYGHPVGDQVLVKVANALKKGTRKGDLVSRLGGEEFVIASDTDKAGILRIANDVVNHIAQIDFTDIDYTDVNTNQKLENITTSMGIARYRGGGPLRLLKSADKALYHSKQSGRKMSSFYNHGDPVEFQFFDNAKKNI